MIAEMARNMPGEGNLWPEGKDSSSLPNSYIKMLPFGCQDFLLL